MNRNEIPPDKPFVVYVDDNYHYQDEDSRYMEGAEEEAIKRCEEITMESVNEARQEGATAEEMMSHYTSFGEDPFIIGPATRRFSAWTFAREMFEKIAAEKSSPNKP